MAETFDPYHKWLGIAPKDQPANHYRLLAIDLFETDLDVIRDAAEQRSGHVRGYQLSEHVRLSQQILNEIAAARACLLDPQRKSAYDRQLRRQSAMPTPPASPPPPAQPIPPSVATVSPLDDLFSDSPAEGDDLAVEVADEDSAETEATPLAAGIGSSAAEGPRDAVKHVGRLRVSSYERASSLLLSLLISLGLSVAVLLIVWWTNRVYVPQLAVPVEMTEVGDGDGGGDGRASGGTQLDNPTEEAAMGSEEAPPEIRDKLTALTEVSVEKAAQFNDQLDDPALVARKRRGDFGTGGGMGGGSGPGRGLGHGPGKGGTSRRWEIYFIEGNTFDAYARQLDFFGIELGVLLPDNKVAYAGHLAQPKPDTRVGARSNEKRYYLTWRGGGDLQKADRDLLARAGLESTDRIILKFLPPAVESQLAVLEKAHAGAQAKNVRKTRFGIQTAGNGYSFYVMDQSYK